MVTDKTKGVAKALGNPEGPHALARELIGTSLAELLRLPTLEFALLDIKPEDRVEEVDSRSKRWVESGPAFITRLVQLVPTYSGSERQLRTIVNHDDIAGIVVLDTWLRNPDRFDGAGRINRHNVFLEPVATGYRLVAMDFSACLPCGGDLHPRINRIDVTWDEAVYGLFPEFEPHVSLAAINDFCCRLRAVRKQDLEAIVERVPTAWSLDSPTREAIVDMLMSRSAYLAENMPEMLRRRGLWSGELPYDEPEDRT